MQAPVVMPMHWPKPLHNRGILGSRIASKQLHVLPSCLCPHNYALLLT